MFDRIIYADWHVVFPVVAFFAAAGLFAAISWRALRMRRPDIDRFARLPLDDDGDPSPGGRSGFIPDAPGVRPDPQPRIPAARVHADELRCAGPCPPSP